MDQLQQAYQGLACCNGMLQLAVAFPAAIPQLLALSTAIRADIAGHGSTSAGVSAPPGESKPASSSVAAPSSSSPSTAAAPPSPVSPSPFLTIPDVSCLVPRGGKMDVEVSEGGLLLRPAAAAAAGKPAAGAAAAAPKEAAPPIFLSSANVTGVFYLQTKDKYKSGPAGVTHTFVIALAQQVMVSKTGHSVIGISDNGGNIAKIGALTLALSRDVDTKALHNADALTASLSSSPSSASFTSGSPVSAPDQTSLLKAALASVFGRIGEADRSIFVSSAGDSSVKCYSKVNDGVLFPLRRAFVFGWRPLLCITHSDIREVRVGRGGGVTARTFDLDIVTKDGKTHTFSMIDINELEPLRQYVGTRTWGKESKPISGSGAGAAEGTASDGASAQAGTASGSAAPQPSPSASASSEPAPVAASSAAAAAPRASNMNEADSDDDDEAGDDGGDDEDEEGSWHDSDDDDEDEDEDDDEDATEDEADEQDDDNSGTEGEEEAGTAASGGAGASGRRGGAGGSGYGSGHGAGAGGSDKRKRAAAEDDEEDDGGDEDEDDDEEEEAVSDDELKQLLADSGAGGHSGGAGDDGDGGGGDGGIASRMAARKRRK